MIFPLRPNSKSLLAGAVIVMHLAVCLLSPWFHQHPEHDHAEAKGGSHHAHGLPFTPLPFEHKDNDDHDDAILHLFTAGNSSLELLRDASSAHSGNSVAAVVLRFVDRFAAAISNPALSRQIVYRSPILLNPQDYCVLSATNLSPPQA